MLKAGLLGISAILLVILSACSDDPAANGKAPSPASSTGDVESFRASLVSTAWCGISPKQEPVKLEFLKDGGLSYSIGSEALEGAKWKAESADSAALVGEGGSLGGAFVRKSEKQLEAFDFTAESLDLATKEKLALEPCETEAPGSQASTEPKSEEKSFQELLLSAGDWCGKSDGGADVKVSFLLQNGELAYAVGAANTYESDTLDKVGATQYRATWGKTTVERLDGERVRIVSDYALSGQAADLSPCTEE
jgi:hypothetical protein